MLLRFVFDYRSPYAYLANTCVPGLNHPVNYFPVDVLEVMKTVNNQPSPACPSKAKYSGVDAARWAALYQVPLTPNRQLFRAMQTGEFDGSLLSRAALAAQKAGVFEQVHTALFEAVWAGADDLISAEGRGDFLRKFAVGVDVWQLANTPEIREQLVSNDDEAAKSGVFGVPSFLCDGELFFGNDRLDFVRAALNKSGGA